MARGNDPVVAPHSPRHAVARGSVAQVSVRPATVSEARRVSPAWSRLTDTLFCLAEYSNRPVKRRTVELGLAGALLADLVRKARIELPASGSEGEPIVTVADSTPPADDLAGQVLLRIDNEPEKWHVQQWLSVLSQGAYDRVRDRLVRDGLVYAETSTNLLGWARTRYVADPNASYWPCARLAHRVSRFSIPEDDDLVLAGLCRALGIDGRFLQDASSKAVEQLYQAIDGLPLPVGVLLDELDKAAGSRRTAP